MNNVIYCTNCGAKNNHESLFCSACGKPIQCIANEEGSSVASQAAASKLPKKRVPWYNSDWLDVLLLVGVVVFFVANPNLLPKCWPAAAVVAGKWVYDFVQKH